MPYVMVMNGNEFIAKIKRYAKSRGLTMSLETRKGKGSHGRLFLGQKFTTIKDRKKEIGPGLLRAMLRQLDINPNDF